VTAQEGELGIGRRLFAPEEIAQAIERLAAGIAADYRRQPLLLLGVLKGALYFTADLARAIAWKADGPSEIMVDYICVERYGRSGTAGGSARLTKDASLGIAGANLLIVEDIADGGGTLAFLRTFLGRRRPASLRTCVLFDKPARRQAQVPIEYLGLGVPDVFVIGYGLDHKELYRNLPYLAELREGQTV
jgi:hypoxanthine phosphoribosyltransferase